MAIDYNKQPQGIDVSHFQGTIDWDALAAQKPAVVIIKATDGMGVDPIYDKNRQAAIDRKIRWQPYPFLEPGDGPAAIEHFLKADPSGVPAMLDWEKAGVKGELVDEWIDRLTEGTKRAPTIYYGLYPPGNVTPKIKACVHHLAEYRATPRLPPWDGVSKVRDWSKSWMWWQRSPQAREPGIKTYVDLDVLGCALATWNRWYDTGELLAPASSAKPSGKP